MSSGPKERLWVLPVLALCVFAVMVVILLRIVPGPHRELDYVVIGTVSVMVAMLMVFLVSVAQRRVVSDIRSAHKSSEEPSKGNNSSMNILGDLSS